MLVSDALATMDEPSLRGRPVLEDISVVIPTLGRDILEQSLFYITAATARPARIIVVDQGSEPRVARWAQKLSSIGAECVHIPSSERGRALGINRGLAHVETRFVAVTDDDCFVGPDWLEGMAARLRAEPDAIVTGRVEAAGEEAVITLVQSPVPAVYRRPRLKFDSLSGGNMGTSMAVFRKVGFFDEDPRLRTAEDGEWAYRALRAGVPIIYAPEIVVSHFGWRSEADRFEQYKGYARSHGGFYGKYLRKGDLFIALRAAVHHLRCLLRYVLGTLTGDKERALHGRAYLTGLLPGIISGMRKSSRKVNAAT